MIRRARAAGAEVLESLAVGEVIVPIEAKFDADLNFEQVAENLRPFAVELDEQWNLSETIKQAAVEQVVALVANDVGLYEEQLATGGLCRATRRRTSNILNERPFLMKIETLAFSVRSGIYYEDAGFADLNSLRGVEDSAHALTEHVLKTVETAFRPKTGPLVVDCSAREGTYDVVNGLIPQMSDKYSKIYLSSRRMVEGTASYVGNGLEQAESFNDWLQTVDEEEDGDFRAYLQMLANDLLDETNAERPSQLTGALEKMEAEAESLLHRDFVEDILSERLDQDPPIKEWFSLIEQILENVSLGEEVDLIGLLVNLQDSWPADMRDAYKGYAHLRVETVKGSIANILSSYLLKRRCNPTRDRLERILLDSKDSNGESHSRKRGSKKPRQKNNGNGRASVSLKTQLGLAEAEAKPQNTIAILKTGEDGHFLDLDNPKEQVDIKIDKYAKRYPNEPGLRRALEELVDHIVAEPFGSGTCKVASTGEIHIAGNHNKKYRLRRATVRHHSGADSSGNTAGRTRIVYCVVSGRGGNSVAIKEILHHDDFDIKYSR